MEDTSKQAAAQAISKTHVRHGIVALARAGISLEDGMTYMCYTGTREAMVRMGVLADDQLPGCGFVNTKCFTNNIGQSMQVYRRGKSRVEAFVRTPVRPTSWDDLDLFKFHRSNEGREALNAATLVVLNAAMRSTCQRAEA